ncbi:MAG: hypothetical protein LC134_06235 [Chitinophagales bacterium]|nr:hypothetical protein [Chitinophagaceae bacterium]MCZ2299053.1 hypothetical protein [Chitinophagales bacterium]
MNNSIEIQLTVLQNKLQQLLQRYAALQKENEQLKKEIKKLHQININGVKNSVDVEKKIDKYLEEIDKCLLLLNTPL